MVENVARCACRSWCDLQFSWSDHLRSFDAHRAVSCSVVWIMLLESSSPLPPSEGCCASPRKSDRESSGVIRHCPRIRGRFFLRARINLRLEAVQSCSRAALSTHATAQWASKERRWSLQENCRSHQNLRAHLATFSTIFYPRRDMRRGGCTITAQLSPSFSTRQRSPRHFLC